jgi:hypothetical protein
MGTGAATQTLVLIRGCYDGVRFGDGRVGDLGVEDTVRHTGNR